MKDKLSTCEELWYAIIDNSPDYIFLLDPNLHITFINRVFGGFAKEELMGVYFPTCVNKSYRARVIECCGYVLRTGEMSSYEAEYNIPGDSTIIFDARLSALTIEEKIISIIINNTDITKRKRIAKRLQTYEKIVSVSGEHISLIDKNYVYNVVNDVYLKAHNKSRSEIEGHTIAQVFGEKTFCETLKHYVDRCLSGENINYQAWLNFHGIGRRFMDVFYYPLYENNGEVAAIVVNARDVTERKLAEEASKESEERFHRIFEDGPLGIYINSLDYRFIKVNAMLCKMVGYTEEELIALSFAHITHPEDVTIEMDMIEQVKRGKLPYLQLEKRYIKKDGSTVWVNLTATIIKDNTGTPLYYLAMSEDINKRKEAEIKTMMMAKFPEENPNPVFRVSRQFNILYTNKACIALFNSETCVRAQCTIYDVLTEYFKYAINEVFNTGNSKDIDMQIGDRTFSFSIAPVSDINCVNVYGKDITEIAQAKKALQESEERYRSIFQSNADAFLVFDNDGKIIDANHKACVLYGYSYNEMINTTGKDIVEPKDYHIFGQFKEIAIGQWFTAEYVNICKDGTPFNVEVHGTSFMFGNSKCLLSIVRDTTQRKQMEILLKQSLEEKNILIKEIHHRVKNNMQIISSLLGLQVMAVKDEKYKEILQESQSRIKTMALVHEKLYQSEDLIRIDFKDYISSVLVDLINTFGEHTHHIKITTDIESIFIEIDIAIPVALIINEILTNSIKHAFPDDRQGDISISIHNLNCNNDYNTELIIKDNGIGLPQNINMDNLSTLGLSLVTALSQQLDAYIDIKNENGTLFTMCFNCKY
ncbi:MAG: PAS domain S-box protein [Candidatus Magnetoovum sp. WYHC-5]|nr:PAS domain S-box protein [Candidatus Magnetoovum sp. WYHC-5]